MTFLHKGACDKNFEGGNSRPGGWMEMKHFLARLCHNAGLTHKLMPEAFLSAGTIPDEPEVDPEAQTEWEQELEDDVEDKDN